MLYSKRRWIKTWNKRLGSLNKVDRKEIKEVGQEIATKAGIIDIFMKKSSLIRFAKGNRY